MNKKYGRTKAGKKDMPLINTCYENIK